MSHFILSHRVAPVGVQQGRSSRVNFARPLAHKQQCCGLNSRVIVVKAEEEALSSLDASEELGAVGEGVSFFRLSFLWLDKNIAVSVDQVTKKAGAATPITEFFFWPRRDAWEELKDCLEVSVYP